MNGRFLADASNSLAFSRILIGLWLLLWTAQWFKSADLFSERGTLPWAMLARAGNGSFTGRLRRQMSTRVFRILLIAQLAVVTTLVVTNSVPMLIGCLVLLIMSVGGFVWLTGEFWADGSDKIGLIAMYGTLLVGMGVGLGAPTLALAGVLVTGGQVAVCYMTAGISKMVVADWRSGAELAGVMSTKSWGHAMAEGLVRHRAVALIATWIVILGEALFPLALLAPPSWLLASLGAFLLFHIATAILMGLNTFPWAFAAAYPSVILLGRVLRSSLGWGG